MQKTWKKSWQVSWPGLYKKNLLVQTWPSIQKGWKNMQFDFLCFSLILLVTVWTPSKHGQMPPYEAKQNWILLMKKENRNSSWRQRQSWWQANKMLSHSQWLARGGIGSWSLYETAPKALSGAHNLLRSIAGSDQSHKASMLKICLSAYSSWQNTIPTYLTLLVL